MGGPGGGTKKAGNEKIGEEQFARLFDLWNNVRTCLASCRTDSAVFVSSSLVEISRAQFVANIDCGIGCPLLTTPLDYICNDKYCPYIYSNTYDIHFFYSFVLLVKNENDYAMQFFLKLTPTFIKRRVKQAAS